jgi:2-oxoglutarate dehydrogenase E2 component (dihydrolipoamide succinyltransferase)
VKVNVKVPSLGESVVEARIAHWLKGEGDKVKVGDVLVELETEKVNVEVTAENEGILTRVMAHDGDTVHVGDLIGEIETYIANGETISEKSKSKMELQTSEQDDAQRNAVRERITPVAKRVAEEGGLDLSEMSGIGTGGRVTKRDVESYLQTRKGPEKPRDGAKERDESSRSYSVAQRATERVRMSLRRKTIARRMLEAQQTAAMLTTFNEVNMERVMNLRKKYKEHFIEKYGVRLGIVSFFVKAVTTALKEYPRLNAEIDGDEIVYKHYYDIGIAIGAEEGLVVPVLRNAETMSIADIEVGIKDFVEKSKSGTLSLEDLRGGTFTITNGGIFGSLMSTPILNPPQVGILGLHKITDRPVVEEGQIVIRPMMYVALTYDHRIVDGSESVQFLAKVKELVEDPAAMILE